MNRFSGATVWQLRQGCQYAIFYKNLPQE